MVRGIEGMCGDGSKESDNSGEVKEAMGGEVRVEGLWVGEEGKEMRRSKESLNRGGRGE